MTDEPKISGEVRTAESDVLAFFYADAAGALQKLRDEAERLARFAERLGGAVRGGGINATTEQRAAFHRACELADRTAVLTFRLLATLDID